MIRAKEEARQRQMKRNCSSFYWIAWLITLMDSLKAMAWCNRMRSSFVDRSRSRRQNFNMDRQIGRLPITQALSDDFLENDLVAVQPPTDDKPRLCVVRPDGSVLPLCKHEDDVETDLFTDPRSTVSFWTEVTDDDIKGTYGEGWYGQRPVPSLGGGPGYGAEADEIWTVDLKVLERIEQEGVVLPVLDVGPSHGEKARGGVY